VSSSANSSKYGASAPHATYENGEVSVKKKNRNRIAKAASKFINCQLLNFINSAKRNVQIKH
jgi:hypothetical protein